ncbi:MAG: SMP-30/gluconolactonase/LRE family protein [Acidobacteriia bacterium]|nr:SMP-30/gluconolactonase/LRE family protein [Terriglobia bacterium]
MSFSDNQPRLELPRQTRNDRLALLVVIAATALARFIPAWMLGTEVADLSTYRHMALTVMRDQDIYDIPTFFPYTPLSLFLPVVGLRLANSTGIPFHMTMKIFPFVGDLGSAALVYLVARRRWPTVKATLAGLAFAFNPISIMVTGLHGNIMPLSTFFAFWAYYVAEFGTHKRSYLLSALVLGIGIGLRSWPVLLTPLLARPGKMSWRQRCVYFIVAALPAVLVLTPYMLVNCAGVVREAFGYKSTPDFGWVAVWRYWRFYGTDNVYMPWPRNWLANSRFYFLSAYTVLVALAYVRARVIDTTGWVMAALLLNFTMLGGVAAQYFSWIVPFLVLRPYFLSIFSLIAGAALFDFYLTWHPKIVLGPYALPFAYTRADLVTWGLVSLAALWVTGFLWLLWTTLRIFRSLLPGYAQVPAAGNAPPASYSARSDGAWVNRAIVALAGAVVLAVVVEVPYLIHSRPAVEWPAHFAWVMSQWGRKPGQLAAAVGVAAHPSGDVFVADIANARVQRFSATGNFLGLWPRAEGMSAGLIQPSDVTVSASGTVYALDSAGAIVRLDEDGGVAPVVDLKPWSVYTPHGLAVDDPRRRFYVTDTGTGRVLVIGMDGTLIDTWGGEGKAFSFDLGWGVGVDSRGNVFVAEQGNSRIRKFSPAGVVLAEWWAKGDLFDIAVGPDDRVYATASDRPRLWIYDNDGKQLGQVSAALMERRLPGTRAVAVAASGEVALTTEAAVAKLLIDESAVPR